MIRLPGLSERREMLSAKVLQSVRWRAEGVMRYDGCCRAAKADVSVVKESPLVPS